MAANDYIINVPDRSAPYRLPRTLTVEEVRQTLVGMGHTAVENSELQVSPDGQTLTFKRVTGGRALMQTPAGSCEIGLHLEAARPQGTIDWIMTFPDGTVERAYSRLADLGDGSCAYTFVLTPPKAPMEQLEGTLEVQTKTLAQELAHLRRVLEARSTR